MCLCRALCHNTFLYKTPYEDDDDGDDNDDNDNDVIHSWLKIGLKECE